MKDIQEKGIDCIDKLTASHLRNLIRYRFRSEEHKKKNKSGLVDIAKRLYSQHIVSESAAEILQAPENNQSDMEEVDRVETSSRSDDDASRVEIEEI